MVTRSIQQQILAANVLQEHFLSMVQQVVKAVQTENTAKKAQKNAQIAQVDIGRLLYKKKS